MADETEPTQAPRKAPKKQAGAAALEPAKLEPEFIGFARTEPLHKHELIEAAVKKDNGQ